MKGSLGWKYGGEVSLEARKAGRGRPPMAHRNKGSCSFDDATCNNIMLSINVNDDAAFTYTFLEQFPTRPHSRKFEPLMRLLPGFTVGNRPAACMSLTKEKIMPSQPRAAMTSTVTGNGSVLFVILEIYGTSPIGSTTSGAPPYTDNLVVENGNGLDGPAT